MSEYEIRLHRPDGALSIVMKVMAVGNTDAKKQALAMLRGGLSNAHIWRDEDLVASVYARDWSMQQAAPLEKSCRSAAISLD